jgi:hypothetical protein
VMVQRSWFGVPDDARIPEALDWVRAALERTQTVADQPSGSISMRLMSSRLDPAASYALSSVTARA